MKHLAVSLLIIFSVMLAQETTQPDSTETHEFRADVARLMDIIINSLYTHKEVFLREMISNASDALDKIKYNALTAENAPNPGTLEIKIELDKENKIFSITDTGIGMTKDHLIKYLGSVAKSGTTQFIEAITKSQGDLNLIGQFGVGFYSVFLVADKVDVYSKHDDDNQYIWTSSAGGTFTVYQDPNGNTLGRGTKVSLHLKQDAEEFLEDENIEKVIEKYSMFINYPIYMWNSKTVDKEVDLTEEELAQQETEAPADTEQYPEGTQPEDTPQEEQPPKKKTKTVREEEWDWELINDQKPIWMRPKEEIERKEYNEFYKALTSDYQDPLSYEHFVAEGEITFKALLFVPTQAPQDLFQDYQNKKAGIKLYVRRVLISEEFEDLVPRYMSFLKGVIDSDDLPLNVARENLQQQKVIKLIGKKLARKAIQMIGDISKPQRVEDKPEKPEEEMNEEEKEAWEKTLEEKRKENEEKAKKDYETFWKEFGKNIKLGVVEDAPNRAKLAKLLRFYSTKDLEKLTGLDEYMERMKEDQKDIYYIAGTDKNNLDKSPLIQRAKKLGLEVLLLEDPIDEYTLTHLQEYEGLKLANAAKSDTKFGESEARKEVKLKEMYRPLTKWLKDTLTADVDKVLISSKLETIPFAVTTGDQGWTANMERIQRAQALGGQARGWDHMKAKKTLEINPSHPIVKQMLKTVENNEQDKNTERQAKLLFNSALMQSGFILNDPSQLSDMIQDMVSNSMGVDNEPIEEPYIEPEPEQENAEDLTDAPSGDQNQEEQTHDYEEDSQQKEDL